MTVDRNTSKYNEIPDGWTEISDDDIEFTSFKNGDTYIIGEYEDNTFDVTRKFNKLNSKIYYNSDHLNQNNIENSSISLLLKEKKRQKFINAVEDVTQNALYKYITGNFTELDNLKSIKEYAGVTILRYNNQFTDDIINQVYNNPTEAQEETIKEILNEEVYNENKLEVAYNIYFDPQ
jgi:hypothetical protein